MKTNKRGQQSDSSAINAGTATRGSGPINGFSPSDGSESMAKSRSESREVIWANLIPDEEWAVYHSAIQIVRETGAEFLLGGAFGLAAYTARLRNTKDIDFFVHPRDRDAVIAALTNAGFEDYYETRAYDRGWIYRATKSGILVDVIWGMPNRRGEVDDVWFQTAPTIQIRGESLGVIPAEELLWIKMYVMQRDRCDWPDLINLLYATADSLDWNHVMDRLENDLPLLIGLLNVFSWVCPDRAGHIDPKIRAKFHLPKVRTSEMEDPHHHIRLLDSRPWFSALQPADKTMQL